MYETLMTKEEASKAIDEELFYRIPADNRDLNYDKYLAKGSHKITLAEEYNSDNTKLLDVEEVKEKLLSLEYIRDELSAWRESR